MNSLEKPITSFYIRGIKVENPGEGMYLIYTQDDNVFNNVICYLEAEGFNPCLCCRKP